MINNSQHPRLTREGIHFTVLVDFVSRRCVVTRDALQSLSQLDSAGMADADVMALFQAYEARISGVARRLCAARVAGNPLLMSMSTFNAPHTA